MLNVANPQAITLVDVGHRYRGVLALQDVSLGIDTGSFTSILGANGAGKSTLGLILTSLLKPTSGAVRRSRPGLRVSLVPEGRRLFGQLTIRENLTLGAYGAGCSRADTARRFDRAMMLMPQTVRDDAERFAATLSGGERQMLALGRALMAEPDVLILDEPSLGLAPILIHRVYEVLAELNQAGTTIVVIEQLATHAVVHAKTMFLLERGRIAYHGATTGEAAEAALRAGYVGDSVENNR